MIEPVTLPDDFPPGTREPLALIAGAVVIGTVTGFVGVAFMRGLQAGNNLRLELIDRLSALPTGVGLALFAAAAGCCAAFAAWLVIRFSPNAAGSGIPYVEAILRGSGHPDHRRVLPVKFFGGLVALSSGLVLGREGPLVQMGAVIGDRFGRFFGRLEDAWKPLMAAGSSAGVAAAFNAPVGATVFILEEVLKKATPLPFTLAAAASVAAAGVQRGIFGMNEEYSAPDAVAGPIANLWAYVALGILLGALGILYNRLILTLDGANNPINRIAAVPRAFAIGAVVALVGWFLPYDVTGGDVLTEEILSGDLALWLLVSVAAVRFLTGPLSYAARTPGGIFAPIIALGALAGASFGSLLESVSPELAPSPAAFAIAGMAAFFTATISAPLTGIVICLEMTGCYQLFLPMLSACFGAYAMSNLLRGEPIYDALAAGSKMQGSGRQ